MNGRCVHFAFIMNIHTGTAYEYVTKEVDSEALCVVQAGMSYTREPKATGTDGETPPRQPNVKQISKVL